jgi:hypothetical protein
MSELFNFLPYQMACLDSFKIDHRVFETVLNLFGNIEVSVNHRHVIIYNFGSIIE